MQLRDFVAALAATLAFSSLAKADDLLEIKGFHLGMKNWEVKAHESDFCYSDFVCNGTHKTRFTVGGIKGKFLSATYDGSAAANFLEFSFDSFGFDRLRAALVEKYPGAICVNSEVVTRLGLHEPQIVCRYEAAAEGIYLVRVAGNINRSVMFLMSAEKRAEVREHIADANKDL